MGRKEFEKQLREQSEQLKNILTEKHELERKIRELENKKELMILTVNVTGVQDIKTTLTNATAVVQERLAGMGLKDKYHVLAIPHTLSLEIPR